MKPTEKTRLIDNLKKYVQKNSTIDVQTIDFNAEIDENLTYVEAKNEIVQKLKERGVFATPSIKDMKTEIETQQALDLKRVVDDSKQQFNDAIEQMKSTNSDSEFLNALFFKARHYVKILAQAKEVNSMVFCSNAGFGKTHQIHKSMAEIGKSPDTDYVLLNSYSTPLRLYEFLFQHNGKIIVLDDILSLFDSKLSVGILLAALWNPTGVRKVAYNSSSDKLKVPQEFVFTGKIVMLLNKFPNDYPALKSRGIYYELKLSYQDIIKGMYEVAKIKNVPVEVVDYIKEITSEANDDISFRDLIKANEIYANDPENWKPLVAEQLEVNPELVLLLDMIQDSIPVSEQLKVWTDIGHSRRDYFRKKKLIVERISGGRSAHVPAFSGNGC